jgi:phosphoribosylaminoimidazole-succinocarboxamide synthase
MIISPIMYGRVSRAALEIYKAAAAHAESRGLILADTKLEFGLLENNKLILIDELLTPDSSRYWPLASYEPGRGQDSFDKQFVRDWIVSAGFKKGREEEEWSVPDDVVKETERKYYECLRMLTGAEVA